MRRTISVAALAAASLVAPPAHAAPPPPFGHACLPQNGVLFCPTASDAERVPSWDGVPLDADVTLPPSGDGPFPAIVMLHGWGGSKTAFESNTGAGDYNNLFYARRGYAVVNYSARGWGRSCGTADSRTSPGCDRGWLHLADHRYEGRDTQHLVGLLVDQGVIRPDAIGVTGISYGGIQTLNLARLRNRMRLEDGSFVPWQSPAGKPLSIAAAWARWAASDLTYALQPNGRFLDFRTPRRNQGIRPGGVMKKSYLDGLYATGTAGGFYAPQGGPFNADITTWKALSDRGEPARPDALAVGRELTRFHSWAGLSGPSPPLLVQNGWTDDLFPAPEALRVYRTFRAAPGARISLQLADLGHPRGQNKARSLRVTTEQGAAFFDAYLKREGRPPAHGSVLAFTQTCPAGAREGRPIRAENWERLHPLTLPVRRARGQVVRSNGGRRATARAIDPIGGAACNKVSARRARGTALVQRRVRRPFTLLGMPTVEASIRTRGRGGFLAARLWDVHRGRMTLVSRGVYRLRDHQRGDIVFQLFGNGWRFRRGHVARLELVGRDPFFLRTSNFRFSVRVAGIRVLLPGR
ncbi:MAG TPA: CocE/NonD family hydrolase [Thermoleophilaceae bacterium]|nr:CocE/NonD family hydrolase [Thermoleophilaceae bacterium]